MMGIVLVKMMGIVLDIDDGDSVSKDEMMGIVLVKMMGIVLDIDDGDSVRHR